MRSLALLLVGAAIAWAASTIEWSATTLAQENALRAPTDRTVVPPLPADPLIPEAAVPKRSVDLLNDPSQPTTSPTPQSTPGAAPTPTPNLVGRFQVSAYANQHGNGCYAIDTATGEIWRILPGGHPEQVINRLPPLITKYGPKPETPAFGEAK